MSSWSFFLVYFSLSISIFFFTMSFSVSFPIFSLVWFFSSNYLIFFFISLSPSLLYSISLFASLFLSAMSFILHFSFLFFSFAFINYSYTLRMFSLPPSTTIADSSEKIKGFRRPGAKIDHRNKYRIYEFLFHKMLTRLHATK